MTMSHIPPPSRVIPLPVLATLLIALCGPLPATAQSPDEAAKRFHVFPQIADGGGWRSVLLATNVSSSESRCTFSLHGVPVDRFHSGISTSGSTATFNLAGQGGYLIWSTKGELELASGYATLDCTDSVVAQVLYVSGDETGATTGMATVFSSQLGGVFQFPVLSPEAPLALAIANDTNTEASCRFVLESHERQNFGEAMLPVPSKSNVARLLSQVIQASAGFTGGSVTVACDQQVAAIGLQVAGTIFATLPPAVLSTTPVSLTQPQPQPSKPFNQRQTERLIGTWRFDYRIGSSDFIRTYRLSEVRESTQNPGEWIIFGRDRFDGLVVAGYSPRLEKFSLLDQGITFHRYFVFDFVGSSQDSVSGCYYQVDPDDNSLSRCYSMTGMRTSSSARSKMTSVQIYVTAAQEDQAELDVAAAEKAGTGKQVEVDPALIEALEELLEASRQ